MPIEETAPRLGSEIRRTILPEWQTVTVWPRQIEAPRRDFFEVVGSRRSRTRGNLPDHKLSALLRHSTQLRERSGDGRFGTWESRTAPSAGGLHALRLLVLSPGSYGLYDTDAHALRSAPDLSYALDLNRQSIAELTGAERGTTIPLIGDGRLYGGCYKGWETLMWRDSGALATILALVASALSLESVIVGRRGDDIVRAAGLHDDWVGAGAIHICG